MKSMSRKTEYLYRKWCVDKTTKRVRKKLKDKEAGRVGR